ncbi:hypothetical protein pipiens_012714 [Culex pipiens pipiens]|uniref:FF domain-containing protein n=1 Tax=Culex pipiens pipiens TaxID=38569 RepID=A0ABD1D1F0_CULPP
MIRERQLVKVRCVMRKKRKEKEVSAFSTLEKELHKIVFDPRYLLLTSKERKRVFKKYVKDRAEEERKEKKNKMKMKREEYRPRCNAEKTDDDDKATPSATHRDGPPDCPLWYSSPTSGRSSYATRRRRQSAFEFKKISGED